MTYLELYLNRYKAKLINTECPGEFFADDDSLMEHDGMVFGCRGMTCEMCWNRIVIAD